MRGRDTLFPSPDAPLSFRVVVFRMLALSAAVYYVYSGFPYDVPSVEWLAVLIALFVIGILDSAAPHDEPADVDIALLIAGVYLFGVPSTLLLFTIAWIAAHVVDLRRQRPTTLADDVATRYVATIACAPALHLIGGLRVHPLVDQYLHVAFLGIVFSGALLVAAHVGSAHRLRGPLLRFMAGSLAFQGSLIAASISVAVLLVMIIDQMGLWAVILALFLLMMMRKSLELVLDIRSSYRATIEALVGAMEVQQTAGGSGIGEQVASRARTVGAALGWFGSRLESVGYAALIHHYGLRLTPAGDESDGTAENPLAEVEFLRPITPILAPLEGGPLGDMRRRDLESAYVVALAIESFSPGRDAEAARLLANRLGADWIAKADRAMRRAQEAL